MAKTPGEPRATSSLMETIRACACGERSITAWTEPAWLTSSVKQPPPLRNLSSSLRGTDAPTPVDIRSHGFSTQSAPELATRAPDISCGFIKPHLHALPKLFSDMRRHITFGDGKLHQALLYAPTGLNLGIETSTSQSSKTTSTGISQRTSSGETPRMFVSKRGPSSSSTKATT